MGALLGQRAYVVHDTVIRGGTIVDGDGETSYTGDISIDGGRISAVGGKAGPAIGRSMRTVCWWHPAGSTYTPITMDRLPGTRFWHLLLGMG